MPECLALPDLPSGVIAAVLLEDVARFTEDDRTHILEAIARLASHPLATQTQFDPAVRQLTVIAWSSQPVPGFDEAALRSALRQVPLSGRPTPGQTPFGGPTR